MSNSTPRNRRPAIIFVVVCAAAQIFLILYFARFFREVADQNLDFVGIGAGRGDKVNAFVLRSTLITIAIAIVKLFGLGWTKQKLRFWIDVSIYVALSALGVALILTAPIGKP